MTYPTMLRHMLLLGLNLAVASLRRVKVVLLTFKFILIGLTRLEVLNSLRYARHHTMNLAEMDLLP